MGGENGQMLVKEYQLAVRKLLNSGDLMFSTVTIVDRAVLYT